MEQLILNKGDKRVLKKYLVHYIAKLETTDYSLAHDFCDHSKEDFKKYHLGMEFIVNQMLHELNSIKTLEEQSEIDNKWNQIKNRIINK